MTLYRTRNGAVFNSDTGALTPVGDDPDLQAWRQTLPLFDAVAHGVKTGTRFTEAATAPPQIVPAVRASTPGPRPYDLLEADCLEHARTGDSIEYCASLSGIWYPATLVSRGEGWVVRPAHGTVEVVLPGGRTPAVRWPGGGKLEPWMRILKPGDKFETNTQHGWSVAELLRVEQNSLAGLCGLRLRWAYRDNPGETWAAFTDCRPHVVESPAPRAQVGDVGESHEVASAPVLAVDPRQEVAPDLVLTSLPTFDAAFEDSLEVVYWFWHEHGKRIGRPRDAFKMAMRGGVRAAFERGLQSAPDPFVRPEWTKSLKRGDPFEIHVGGKACVVYFLAFNMLGTTYVGMRYTYAPDAPVNTWRWEGFAKCRPHTAPTFKGSETYPTWAQALKKGEPFFANGEVAIFVEHRSGQHDRLGLHYEKPDEEPATVRWVDVRACQPYPKSVATSIAPKEEKPTRADLLFEVSALRDEIERLRTALRRVYDEAEGALT